ncbi:MAG: hypothetical protein LBU27_02105 [Candidatus Peribacteria bacterium]|jgi:hypothetical protein|nr:hypothetical protein [Candidatus Peribacteria bacterium]
MQKPTQIFTPDALYSFQNAQSISSFFAKEGQTEASILTPESTFRGAYGFIRESNQFQIFATMLGLKEANTLDQWYQEHFHELLKGKSLATSGSVDIEHTFNDALLQHKNDWQIEHIDFCFLFYCAFLHLSNENQIFKLLEIDHINIKTCMENCKNLLLNPISRQQGAFAFLKILSTIFAQLHLNPTTTNMHININENLEGLEKLLDSVESEIGLDAENTQNDNGETSTTTATKKKEEKKLNIEYFGTDLTKESKDGFIDPIIGRDQEINQVIYTLLRKTKNNPLLIGEP